MRILMLVAVLALTGCANVREALGAYQTAADKGVGVGTTAEAEAAGANDPAQVADGVRSNLPATLGGDAENRAYSTPPKP